jgi:predicted GNAT family acetyltransferase
MQAFCTQCGGVSRRAAPQPTSEVPRCPTSLPLATSHGRDNQTSLRARRAQDAAPPIRRRKRGDELRAATHTAVLDELREHGFAALNMDAVAARAHTGKTRSTGTAQQDADGLIAPILEVLRRAAVQGHIPVAAA